MYEVYISLPKKLVLLGEFPTLLAARQVVDFLLGRSSDLNRKYIIKLNKVLNLQVEQNSNGTISVKFDELEELQTLYIQKISEKNLTKSYPTLFKKTGEPRIN